MRAKLEAARAAAAEAERWLSEHSHETEDSGDDWDEDDETEDVDDDAVSPARFWFSSRQGLSIAIVLLLFAAGGGWFIVSHYRGRSSAQQLSAAWTTFNGSYPSFTSKKDISAGADDIANFVSEVGRFPFPSQDEVEAHAVVQAAIALEGDVRASTWQAPTTATTCPLCASHTARGVNWGGNFTQDRSTFNSAVDMLFSNLGMKGPVFGADQND